MERDVAGAGPSAHRDFTGFPSASAGSFGSYVSRFRAGRHGAAAEIRELKGRRPGDRRGGATLWVGAQHRAFVPNNKPGIEKPEITRQVDLSRLKSRKELLTELDTRCDARRYERRNGAPDVSPGADMLTSGKARRAFDLERRETGDARPLPCAGGDKFMYSHLRPVRFRDWQAFVRARASWRPECRSSSDAGGTWDHHCADKLPSPLSRTVRFAALR
jgi:hypothetical protein